MAEKILIVDDDADTLKLVGLMLERQGYEIIVAYNGSQALSKVGSHQPDLILLDAMMPDMDGYAVTRKIRNDPSVSHIPIIMFTAKTMVNDRVEGFEAGVDDYMTKPTHPAELASRVKSLLARNTRSLNRSGRRGNVIGVLGVKGGLGTSTLALNLATVLAEQDQDVLLTDYQPGAGTLGPQLGIMRCNGLTNLLAESPGNINLRAIEGQLVNHSSGLRLLLSSDRPEDVDLTTSAAQGEVITRQLATLSDYVVIDLGSDMSRMTRQTLPQCSIIFIVVEPVRLTLRKGRRVLDLLEDMQLEDTQIDVVMIDRGRASVQVPWQAAEDALNHNIVSVIPAVPEVIFQAMEAGQPIVTLHPKNKAAQQYIKLADKILEIAPPKEKES